MPDQSVDILFRIRHEGQEQLKATAGIMRDMKGAAAEGGKALQDEAKGHDQAAASAKKHGDGLKGIGDAAEKQGKRTSQLAEQQRQELEKFAGSVRNALSNPMQAIGSFAESAVLSLGKAGIVAGAVAATLAIAGKGAYNLAASTGQLAEEQGNMALRTGLSVHEVGLFSAAAEMAGLNSGAFETGMRQLSMALSEGTEEGKRGKRALQELGIQATDDLGRLRPMSEIWLQIADALGKIENPVERSRIAMALLGRGSNELLPLLRGNLRETVKDLERMGVAFTEDGAKKAQAFDDAVDSLHQRIKALKRTLGEKIIFAIDASFPGLTRPQKGEPYAQPGGLGSTVGMVERANASLIGPPALPQENASGARAAALIRENILAGNRLLDQFQNRQNSVAIEKKIQDETIALQAAYAKLTAGAPLDQQKQNIEDVRAIEAKIERLKESLKASEELKQAQKAVADLVYRAQTAELTGLDKIAAERAKAIEQYEKFPSLIGQINAAYNLTAARELWKPVLPLLMKGSRGDSEFELGRTFLPGMLSDTATDQARKGRDVQFEEWGKELDASATKETERRLAAMRETLNYQERLTQLLSGPGGEGAAIEKVYALRVSAAREEFQITRERADMDARIDAAKRDRVLSILELQKRELENLKQGAGQLFDAMISKGGGGLKDFVLGQLEVMERQVFMNLAGEIGGGLKGKLSMPGTTDAQGKPTTLGRILQGTPFGPDSTAGLKLSTERNSTVTELNSAAVQQMTVALKSMGTGGGGAGTGFGALDKVLGYGSEIGKSLGIGDLPLLSDKQTATLINSMPGTQGWDGAAAKPVSSNAGLYKALGYGGAIAAGGFGVYSGVKQGGAQGALTAGSSLAGAAAAITMLAGVTGPAAPILALAGMGMSLIGSFLGDPKKKRQEAIDKELAAAAFTAPTATARYEDLSGRALDYDMRGQLRTVDNRQAITVHITALDAKSVMERGPEIAESVRRQVRDGHPLRLEMQAAQI